MSSIHLYLTFNGNCREAMEFYRKCFGGELELMKVGGSPRSRNMPRRMKNCILHATLRSQQIVLMGSDMVREDGLMKGNSVSMLLDCSSDREIRKYYRALSSGGRETDPLARTFAGSMFGGLTDKYGNHWLLNYERNRKRENTSIIKLKK